MFPIEDLMDQRSALLSPESLAYYRQVWNQGVLYLTLKAANLPTTLRSKDRAAMQDGIRRCLMVMLDELEAVEPGATAQLLATVHGLAGALGDTH